jgi:hypothetical protein
VRRIAASTLTQVTGTFLSGVGNPENATGTVTCAVTDGAGVAVDSGDAEALGSGRYGFDVDLTALDVYTATFTGAFTDDASRSTSTTFEVVGGIPLSVVDIRADEDLADVVKYPNDTITAELQAAWDVLEKGLKVAIVPRGCRETVDGFGVRSQPISHLFPRQVLSAAVGGSVVDVSGLTAKRHGVIVNPSGWAAGDGNVDLHYTHGWDTPPDPVLRALRLLTIDRLVTRATPSRATSLSTDVGAFRLTIAGRDGVTGIPDVDAIIDQFGYASAVGFA